MSMSTTLATAIIMIVMIVMIMTMIQNIIVNIVALRGLTTFRLGEDRREAARPAAYI